MRGSNKAIRIQSAKKNHQKTTETNRDHELDPVYIFIFIDVIDTQLSERKGRCYDTDRTLIRVFEQPKHPGS